jgi:pyrroline-5-carboxylate reductase
MEKENKIGIIGCGNMGNAIAKGIIYANVITGGELYLYDIELEKAGNLKDSLNANITNSPSELACSCNIILIAVKPQDIGDLLKEMSHVLDSSKLVISIAAGTTIAGIKKLLNEEVRVVRVMPNMPALVNQGISALCYDSRATTEDKDLARKIFESIGDIIETKEKLIDAVTAISGSGPAYFFYLTEILEKNALDMGLGANEAKLLAIKTALGSAALLRESDLDAEALRKRVTSKGGTTEAAFKVFKDKKLAEILQEGIQAAKERAKELRGGS